MNPIAASRSPVAGRDEPRTDGDSSRVIDVTEVEDLLIVVQRLSAELVAARRRSDHLDGRLGHALLSLGMLRGQLQDAGLTPVVFGAPRQPSDDEGS